MSKKHGHPAKETTKLYLEVEYDPDITDPEGLASALDRLLDTATSTPGLLEEYGDPSFGLAYVMPKRRRRRISIESNYLWDQPPFAPGDPNRPRSIAETGLFDVPGIGPRLHQVCNRLFDPARLAYFITNRFWSIPDLPVEAFAAYTVEEYTDTRGCGAKLVLLLQRYLSRLGIKLRHRDERSDLAAREDLGRSDYAG